MSKTTLMNIAMAITSAFAFTVSAADRVQKPEKLEIRHAMLGYRATVVFYSFKAQRAILVLEIDNKDETFPVTGTVHLFDKATTEEALERWINNQHSDALFVDIPKPILTRKLPAGFCALTSSKQIGTSENPGPRKAIFKEFELMLSIKAQDIGGAFMLPAFSDTARVHVESK